MNFDLLKRSNVILAERDQPVDATHLYLNRPNDEEPQYLNIVHFNRIYVDNSAGYEIDLRLDVFYNQIEFNVSYAEGQLVASLISVYGSEKTRKMYLLSTKPDYWSFVFYMRDLEFGWHKLYHYQPIYFFGLDEDTQLELSVYNFYQDTHELLHTVHLDAEELFDCFTRLTHERQLKGVFYDFDNDLWFVFIKRFYLQINKVDLIRSEFVLPANWYETKAHRLHLLATQAVFYEKIESEFLGRKWVKAIGPNTVYSANNRDFFRLTVKDKEELNIESTTSSGFRNCYHQALIIDQQHVFCMKRREYYYLYSLGNESSSHYWNKVRYCLAQLVKL